MGFQKAARKWRGRKIGSRAFTEYPVRTSEIDQSVLDHFGLDREKEWALMYQDEIDDLCFESDTAYQAVDWDDGDVDEEYQQEVLNSLIHSADWYLVYASGVTWDGRSGYKFVRRIDQAFYRDYDSYICADAASRNGKTLRCRESSHDVPMGQFTWVIALTGREYETLQYATFNQIRAFVDRHDSAIKD